MPRKPRFVTIFRIFAARAAAELQRLRAEQAVKLREEKYRRIVETAGEGFILMDESGVIKDVNPAFCRIAGAGREGIIGRRPPDLSTIEPHAFFLQETPPGSTKDHYDFECRVVAASGEKIPVLVHGSILRDDRGAVIGKMAFVTDMRHLKKSLALAAEVQRSFLPRSPVQVTGLDVDWKTVSCDDVGGDYIDCFQGGVCGGGDFAITVGDVMGHGVDAALMMMSARAFLRIHAAKCHDISQLITRMNHSFTQDARLTSRFMTLFYLAFSPKAGRVRWVRAGHEPAVVYDPSQDAFSELKGPGLALGLDENYAYEASVMNDLRAGQIIAVGTDGIWEARNAKGAMYGRDRFCRAIRGASNQGAGGIIAAVFEDLSAFTAGRKPSDDMTLAVVKVASGTKRGIDFQI
jgi:sigma-B regulation protein RsbU (phosphoserine phosphatase)